MFLLWYNILYASVAELADALDLGSSAFRRAGSIPVTRTNFINQAHVEFAAWAFWLFVSTVKQKNAVGGFTAHVAIAAWAFLYTEICNSVYTNKLKLKNNL